MVVPYRKTYRPWQPELYHTQAVTPQAKLPDGDLVFFLIDLMPLLDLAPIYAVYEDETRGAPPFDPTMMTCLLLYSYSVGVFSSRKIALACERNLAFLAIVGPERPDFRTISDFRKIHLNVLKHIFVQTVRLAREAGLLKLGHLSTDGTKVAGNASRHKAMSYGYMLKEEERLTQEMAALLQQAQAKDDSEDAALGCERGDELPDELSRRQQRLDTIRQAKERLEAATRAAAKEERQRRAEEEEERQRQGKKRRGKAPGPISEIPDPKDQISFTDPDLKIMKQNNKGWEYSGNAQATVDSTCQIIVACDVTDATNDKQQGVPMGAAAKTNLEAAGVEWPRDEQTQEPVKVPHSADSGYYSKETAEGLETQGYDPHLATGRQKHHAESVATVANAEPVGKPTKKTAAAAAKEAMAAKLRTPEGKAVYARRKVIIEPVFGQIKGARGFRRFLLRGLEKVRGEWCLVCLTHNLLKLWRYGSVLVESIKVA
jgi:transposase